MTSLSLRDLVGRKSPSTATWVCLESAVCLSEFEPSRLILSYLQLTKRAAWKPPQHMMYQEFASNELGTEVALGK
jgi:hypothetical protein